MIGVGKWKAVLSSKYVNGDCGFTIADKDGAYDISIEMPEQFKSVKLNIGDVAEVGDNKLTAKARIAGVPLVKDVDIELTFDGDTAEGLLSFGKMGSVKVKDGKKVG